MEDALALAVVVGVAVWLWQWSVATRERVLAISARVCRELGLQQLDETAALRRMEITRSDGHLKLRRVYGFEFSLNGADRHLGEVSLLGGELEWVLLEHPDGQIVVDAATATRPRHLRVVDSERH
jgi:hypothetical protein